MAVNRTFQAGNICGTNVERAGIRCVGHAVHAGTEAGHLEGGAACLFLRGFSSGTDGHTLDHAAIHDNKAVGPLKSLLYHFKYT